MLSCLPLPLPPPLPLPVNVLLTIRRRPGHHVVTSSPPRADLNGLNGLLVLQSDDLLSQLTVLSLEVLVGSLHVISIIYLTRQLKLNLSKYCFW